MKNERKIYSNEKKTSYTQNQDLLTYYNSLRFKNKNYAHIIK
jgi:hypothetical protein